MLILTINFYLSFKNLIILASVVLLSFSVCWLPFLTSLNDVIQVLIRLFPFSRGLFEVSLK